MFPEKVAQWFSIRGIPQETLRRFNIHWNGKEVVIPIKDTSGKTLFNKYRRDPESNDGPKYRYDTGGKVSLFNPSALEHDTIIVVEGELDAVRLEADGFHAISSTGGVNSFQKEWLPLLVGKKIYICFDNDEPGIKGAIKLYSANNGVDLHLMQFPEYFHGKDVTDFLQHHTRVEFDTLIENAIKPEICDDSIQKCIDACVVIRRELKSKKLSTNILEGFLNHLLTIKATQSKKKNKEKIISDINGVKQVSIENFIEFNPARFAKRCIWHSPDKDQRTPSLFYYPKTNSVYCFSCGKSGDVISVIRETKGVDFLGAIEILKKYL